MKIGYLLSQYLAFNHAYLVREIRGLRVAEFDVVAVSVLPPDRSAEKLSPEEQEENARTKVIRTLGPLRALGIVAGVGLRRPLGLLRGLATAARLAGPSPARFVRHLFYLAEAVIAGAWFLEEGVTHFHNHFASTVALLVARVFPISTSVTFHGPAELADPVGFRLKEKIEGARFVCAISHYARSRLMSSCEAGQWGKIEVSRLGVDPSIFEPATFRESPERFELLSVGRLAAVKAYHVLIGAVGRLRAGGANVRLRLVGDGPDREELAAHAAALGLGNAVRFEGSLNQDRVRELYRKCDVFALASFEEGVPVVLMEAMAMEIPCVATHITGVPELIRNEVDGLLVAPSDEEGLAAAIRRLIDDPELRRRLGPAARRRVSEEYDLARNTGKLAEIFRRRLAR